MQHISINLEELEAIHVMEALKSSLSPSGDTYSETVVKLKVMLSIAVMLDHGSKAGVR